MSTKTFEEVQSIKVNVEKHICDLCEKVIENGSSAISIGGVKLYDSSPLRLPQGRGWSNISLEVCSTDCLVKNIGGVSILLNTKILPSIDDPRSPTYDASAKCEEVAPKNFNYH